MELNHITTAMMEHLCDHLCRYPREVNDQDKLTEICSECMMSDYVRNIIKTGMCTNKIKEV